MQPNVKHQWPRSRVYLINRSLICLVVVAAEMSFLFTPSGPLSYVIDILLRTYLIFIGTVMAHEGVHGHLGRTKATNLWWGRFALIPSMVPFTNFHKTHHLHHTHTNIPEKDPDIFMRSRSAIEIPFRAVAMPHQWFFWLWKRDRIKRADIVELLLNYVAIVLVHSVICLVADPERVFFGLAPALVLVSVLLWYPFAVQTHEGFSTLSPETRSHNYYGHFMYWFSLGLGMHRVHHVQPGLSWLELRQYVEKTPKEHRRWFLLPARDIRL
jgi:ring-1,2-phenylacetyl-CoA epoxidase subunit PaaE